MTTTMIRVTETKAEVLSSDGWQEADWVPLPGGNFLNINAESYYSGLFHGIAGGMLASMFALAVVAILVTG